MLSSVRRDALTRNSAMLVFNYGVIGGIGAVCSVIAAREWSPRNVGAVAAIIGVAGLLTTASSVGLASTITRFLREERNQLRFVLEAIYFTTIVGLGLCAALCFVPGHFGVPLHDLTRSDGLSFLLVGGYVAGANIVAVTDPAFLARSEVSFTVAKDIIASTLRVGILIAFIGTGAAELLGVSVIYGGIAAVLDLVVVVWRLRDLDTGQGSLAALTLLRGRLRFAAGSHTAALVAVIPGALLATIVAAAFGATAAAYVTIPLSFVVYINIIPSMTAQALLADLGQAHADVASRMVRALRISYLGTVPAAIVVFAAAPLLLLVFGHSYSVHGTDFLRWAVAATPLVVFNYVGDVVLLSRQRVGAYNAVNVLGTIAILACLLAAVQIGRRWIGPAYFEGQFLYGVVSLCTLVRNSSRQEAVRAARLLFSRG